MGIFGGGFLLNWTAAAFDEKNSFVPRTAREVGSGPLWRFDVLVFIHGVFTDQDGFEMDD